MIGPKFSEQVEYLFNYAPSEFASWARWKFTGTPARAVLSVHAVMLLVGVAVAVIVASKKDGE